MRKINIIPNDGFLCFPSWINIYLTEDFIVEHLIPKTDVNKDFVARLGDIFDMIGRVEDRQVIETIRAATYSFFY